MDETKIREYARLMEELGLTGIEVNEKKGTIRLERENTVLRKPATSVADTVERTADAEAKAPDMSAHEAILSPMVGVFYTAPAADAEPFVRPGQSVKKGQVICIIESMKLMNEIQAEEDCVIGEALVRDGAPVEYGTKLFSITD